MKFSHCELNIKGATSDPCIQFTMFPERVVHAVLTAAAGR